MSKAVTLPIRIVFLLILVLHSSSSLSTTSPIHINALNINSEPLLLASFIEVLEDQERKLTFEQVLKPSIAEQFEHYRASDTSLSFGYTPSAYWLRFKLNNPSDKPIKRVIEISYASLSYISFFYPDTNNKYQAINTGSNPAFSTRPYPNRFFVFPITIPAQSTSEFYTRIQGTSSLVIPMKLWEPQAYFQHARNDYFIQALYFGIACAMLVFNLLLFFALRDRIYLLYGMCVTSIAFAFASDFGLSKEVLWPNNSNLWSDIANFIGYSFSAIALLLFMRAMVKTKELAPQLDKLVITTVALNMLTFFGFVTSLETFALATASLYIATVFVILGTAFYCSLFKQSRSARFFLAASSAFLIGCIIGGLNFVGITSSNFFTENAMQIGSALEMLLLAFALADRVSELQREKRIAAIAFESQEGIIITDANRRIIRVNSAFTDITGYQSKDVVGNSPRMLNSSRHDGKFHQRILNDVTSNGIWQGEMWNRHIDGQEYPVLLTITAVKNEKGKLQNYVGTLIDISARKKAEAEINSLAFYDPLTQLPNRRMLMKLLKTALTSRTHHHDFAALLFIDLDDFKSINDTLGHDFGDALLKEVAMRLTSQVHESDSVSRLGGDEFVVLLDNLGTDIEVAATNAEVVSERIVEALTEPYVLDGYTHICGASIGVSIFSEQQLSVDELLKRTDLAMYEAKKRGGNSVQFFDPDMQRIALERFALEASLHDAVLAQQFKLHYQPIFNDREKITGVEALVRWSHPERGLVPPSEFISIAESSKLIIPIGQWVLQQACELLVRWSSHTAFSKLTIAVNVSSLQFKLPTFVEDILTVLDKTGAPPKLLKLELTETLLVDDVDDVINKMTALKARGVNFSLDDFGTGYSSLAYIKQMPFDQLKIDKSFVQDILDKPNDATISRTIIRLADSLGLSVVAEGVENEGQYAFLRDAGCHAFQGYFLSRPQAISDIERRVYECNKPFNSG